MTDDELLTQFIQDKYSDLPESEELRQEVFNTTGFKVYVLRVRWREFKEVVKYEVKKILPHN